jgi:predicted lipoprotein with Yx(FWY)xxD motif
MLRFGTIMVAALLLAAVAAPANGHESSAPPPPPKAEKPALPIKFYQTKRGMVLADDKGMTLYYFDRDDTGNKSTCDGKCTEKWIPLAASDDAKALGDFTVIVRSDKTKMWAYRYRPLYTSRDDQAPGDTNGADPSNLWHIARPAN